MKREYYHQGDKWEMKHMREERKAVRETTLQPFIGKEWSEI